MGQLLPHDHQHVDSFGFAMERVARIDQSAPPLEFMRLYGAVQDQLRRDDMSTLPLGSFARLLAATGIHVVSAGERKGNGARIVYGLRLLSADD